MSRFAAQMELARLVDRYSEGEGRFVTALDGVTCLKMVRPGIKVPSTHRPSFCLMVQGEKDVLLGDEIYHYGVGEFLAVSVELPVVGQVTEASVERPYLGIAIELDARILSELLAQGYVPPQAPESGARALFVGRADDGMVDVVLRLMRLLDTPRDVAALAPLMLRELHYRLMACEHGAHILQVALHGSAMQRISDVIAVIKRDFDKPLRIEGLAEVARMSLSSFHHHFKEVTAMSPLQYQKQLRLMEARRLMLMENHTAAGAAYGVGYESSSQFSREYVRAFGLPPAADVERLRLA